jgi:hypothetical protein
MAMNAACSEEISERHNVTYPDQWDYQKERSLVKEMIGEPSEHFRANARACAEHGGILQPL